MPDEQKETSVLGELLDENSPFEPETEKPEEEKGNPDADALQQQLALERQRNDSLQGRVESQLRPMNDIVRKLQGEIEDLKGKKDEEAPKVEVPTDPFAGLDAGELEALGDEPHRRVLAKVVNSTAAAIAQQSAVAVATKAAEKAAAKVRDELATRMAPMEQRMEAQSVGVLWDKVDKLVPGAKQLNERADGAWVDFLEGQDPFSGRPRRDLGTAAIEAGDVRRLADICREFTDQSGSRKGKATARPKGISAQPEVGSADNGKSVVHGSDITEFYTRLNKGFYDKDPKKAEKIEALIESAVAEGRVQN